MKVAVVVAADTILYHRLLSTWHWIKEDIRVTIPSSCTQTFLCPDGVILYPDKQICEEQL